MNFYIEISSDILTRWYTLLIAGLLIGPLFSYAKVDAFVTGTLIANGGGKKLIERNAFTRIIDSVATGTPYWIAFSTLLIQPFYALRPTLMYAMLLLVGTTLKSLLGRAYIDESDVEKSSKTWAPFFMKKGQSGESLKEKLVMIIEKCAFPSMHTLTVFGAIIFGASNPAMWALLIIVSLWMIIAGHHWFSDVFGSIMIGLSIVSYLNS